MTEPNENIILQELIEDHPLSVRALGICMRNGLITLNRLSNHFEKYKTFKNLQGCGDRVEYELTELLTKYRPQKQESSQVIALGIQTILPSYKDLTPFKKSTLNHHIEYLLSTLTVRALNCLCQQFGNSPTKALLEKVIETNFDFQDIRNAGEKTVQELNFFRDKVKSFININTVTRY